MTKQPLAPSHTLEAPPELSKALIKDLLLEPQSSAVSPVAQKLDRIPLDTPPAAQLRQSGTHAVACPRSLLTTTAPVVSSIGTALRTRQQAGVPHLPHMTRIAAGTAAIRPATPQAMRALTAPKTVTTAGAASVTGSMKRYTCVTTAGGTVTLTVNAESRRLVIWAENRGHGSTLGVRLTAATAPATAMLNAGPLTPSATDSTGAVVVTVGSESARPGIAGAATAAGRRRLMAGAHRMKDGAHLLMAEPCRMSCGVLRWMGGVHLRTTAVALRIVGGRCMMREVKVGGTVGASKTTEDGALRGTAPAIGTAGTVSTREGVEMAGAILPGERGEIVATGETLVTCGTGRGMGLVMAGSTAGAMGRGQRQGCEKMGRRGSAVESTATGKAATGPTMLAASASGTAVTVSMARTPQPRQHTSGETGTTARGVWRLLTAAASPQTLKLRHWVAD